MHWDCADAIWTTPTMDPPIRRVGKLLCDSHYRHRPPENYRWFENIATKFLKQQGLLLLVANYRNRTGEIDLIMIDDQTLVLLKSSNVVTESSADLK